MSYIHEALKKAQVERDLGKDSYGGIPVLRRKESFFTAKKTVISAAVLLLVLLAFVGYSWLGRSFLPEPIEGGRQRTEDGGRRTEDRGQRTEDRGQRTEDGGRKTEDGRETFSGTFILTGGPTWIWPPVAPCFHLFRGIHEHPRGDYIRCRPSSGRFDPPAAGVWKTGSPSFGRTGD